MPLQFPSFIYRFLGFTITLSWMFVSLLIFAKWAGPFPRVVKDILANATIFEVFSFSSPILGRIFHRAMRISRILFASCFFDSVD